MQSHGRGDADAQPREAAGTGGNGNAIKVRKVELRPFKDARNQRHQRLGMTACHLQRFMHARVGLFGVEHRSRTGVERSIDGKNAH